MTPSALDQHLATCPECAAWAGDAARATRLVRLDAQPVPDLTEEITATVVLPVRRVLRRRLVLRVLLTVAGVVQLVIGVTSITGTDMGMAMAAHAAHEAAAWNLAIGAAFLGAASTPRRAAGLVPLLATFLLVLGALSIRDAADHAVGLARLTTHAAAVVGLLLLVLLDRAEQALPRHRHPEATPVDDDVPLRTVA